MPVPLTTLLQQRELIRELSEEYKGGQNKTKTFVLKLTEGQKSQLEHLAEYYDTNQSVFLRRVIHLLGERISGEMPERPESLSPAEVKAWEDRKPYLELAARILMEDPLFVPDSEEIVSEVFRMLVKLEELHPRDAKILKLRFGIGYERGLTLKETGEMLGLTRERVYQVVGQAIRRLRHPRRSRNLRNAIEAMISGKGQEEVWKQWKVSGEIIEYLFQLSGSRDGKRRVV